MNLWKKPLTLEALNSPTETTLMGSLGIQFIEIGPDYLRASMPVDKRTHQPYGLLHGGASVALAETMGSVASIACLPLDDDRWCVGIEINANHVRSVTDGLVVGTVRPLHVGHSLHLWEIKITSPGDKLVCVSRLTVSVIAKR